MTMPFIYEFMYRGAPDGADVDTWHVIIGQEIDGLDGKKKIDTHGPITPKQAAEMGWPVSKVFAALNEAALNEASQMREALEYAGECSRRCADLENALTASQTECELLKKALADKPAADS